MQRAASTAAAAALFFALLGGVVTDADSGSADKRISIAVLVSDHSMDTFQKAREALEGAGVRRMQLFPPDAIFLRVADPPGRSVLDGLAVETVREPGACAGKGLDAVTEAALTALLSGSGPAASAAAPGEDLGPIDDLVLRVPPEVVRATTPRGPRLGSTLEMAERGANQNSEFLIGSVLLNIVFPESDGAGENWTDAEISGAITGLTLGIQQYLDRAAWLPLTFTYNYRPYVRIPVSVEPITCCMDNDYLWVGEALRKLGYDDWGAYYDAHSFNNATRAVYKTEWVYTAFIADMSNHYPVPDGVCCWRGCSYPGNCYVAYSYLGGPYMVIPYPACRYGDGLGFGRVFIHEMSHGFWALDEYASAEASCSDRSGYLNVPNMNTLFQPCQNTVECIMQTASPPFTAPLPICEYTMGQVGWVDDNNNSIPDLYDVAPVVRFLNFSDYEVDTLLPGDEYVLAARATNAAVPNQNSQQFDPDLRIDYAPAIVSGEMSINGQPFEPVMPSTYPWDSAREDIVMELGADQALFEPGENTLTLRVKNRFDLQASATRHIFQIGLKFYQIAASADTGRIRLSWTTAAEVFDAVFEIQRADETEGGAAVPIDTVVTPDGMGADRRSYVFYDTDVRVGHRYRYCIVGRFTIDFHGTHAYEFPSSELVETAMIPIPRGTLVSSLLPNPMSEGTSFTIDVPRSWARVDDDRVPGGSASALAPSDTETRTVVDVAVYNVLGQRLRTVYSNSRFGGIMSLVWDGADDAGRLVPPGVYFLRVAAGSRVDVRKIVVLR